VAEGSYALIIEKEVFDCVGYLHLSISNAYRLIWLESALQLLLQIEYLFQSFYVSGTVDFWRYLVSVFKPRVPFHAGFGCAPFPVELVNILAFVKQYGEILVPVNKELLCARLPQSFQRFRPGVLV